MKLSTKSRYGLRIVIQVACDNLEGRLSQGREIAKNQDLTEAYIEQIMIPLKKAGIIKTERGCSGGYMLGKSPEDISIMDLIEVFEGKFVMSPCISGKTAESIALARSFLQRIKPLRGPRRVLWVVEVTTSA